MDKNSNKDIFTGSYKDQVIWFNNFTNDIVGVLGFSLGITALQFGSDASSFATVCLCFLFIYLIYNELRIGSALLRHYKGMKFSKTVTDFFMSNLIYLLGMMFLGGVAGGMITHETFVGFSLKQWTGL